MTEIKQYCKPITNQLKINKYILKIIGSKYVEMGIVSDMSSISKYNGDMLCPQTLLIRLSISEASCEHFKYADSWARILKVLIHRVWGGLQESLC